MNKKKAIKVVTATAIVASAFTAVAPAQSEAAVSVKSQVSASQKAMKKPYITYTKDGKLVSASVVKKQIAAAKSAQAKANSVIKNSKSSAKAKKAYYAQVKAYSIYITRAQWYVNAITLNTRAEEKALAAALEGGNVEEVTTARAALNSKLYKYNKAVAKVYSKAVRDLLNKTYAISAKAVNAEAKKFIEENQDDSKYAETLKAEEAKVNAYAKLADGDLSTQALVDAAKAAKAAINLDKLKVADQSALHGKIVEADAKVAEAEEALKVPAVVGVNALNAKELVVTFNVAVDATDAADEAKYAVEGETISSAVVSEDGKSVTLTTADELKVTNAKVTVKAIKTKADAKVLTAEYNALFTFADKTPVSVQSVEAKGTTAVITFNEPVKDEGTVSLNGVALTSGYTLDGNKLTITGLTAEKSYKVDIVGATDFANNIANPIAVNFTVAKADVDSSKPTVSTTVNGTEITFDFSEELSKQDLGGAVGANEYAKVTVGSTTFFLTDAEIKDANDKTKFTLEAKTALGSNNFVNKTVKVEGFKDNATNAGDAFEFAATLTKDTTPATLVSASTKLLVEDNTTVTADGDALYLTFNEPVKVDGNLTLKTKNGIVYTTGNVTAVDEAAGVDLDGNGTVEGSEKNTVKVDIDLDSNSTYAFELAKDAVVDLNGNKNAEAIAFNVTSGTFQPAPGQVEASLVFGTTPVVVSATNNRVFTVEYAADVTASATTAANYTLGGKALPAGTQLQFVNGTKQVRVTLPEGSIAANGNYVLEAKNVVDTKGNTLKDGKATTLVTLKENVAPVASKVTVVDSKTFTVDFSEAIADQATATGLTVKIAGATVVPATAVAANGKLTITTTNNFNLTDSINVEFKDANLKDVNNNQVKDGSVN